MLMHNIKYFIGNESLLTVYTKRNESKFLTGAPIQVRKWGDKYGERSEPKNFFARRGIIHPETTKLAMLE
jgi:hypothetical protein